MSARTSRDRRLPSFRQEVGIVLRKDFALEARSGEVIVSSGFFALLVVVLASMSFHGGPRTGRLVAAGVIWLSIAFATVLSLGRSWAREREHGALSGLLTTPLSPAALFSGKTLSLFAFLSLIELFVFPVATLFFSIELFDVALGLGLIALLATPGIAAVGTLFGAMTVRTSARDLALSIVLLPLLSPVVLTAIAATRALFEGSELSELSAYLRLIAIFDVAFVGGGFLLFGSLIED